MDSAKLMNALAEEAQPVRRLRPPFVRMAMWLLLSSLWVALIVAVMGVRTDLDTRLVDTRWLIEQGATLFTGLMAAVAAFCAVVPGRPRWERALPLLPASLWLGALALGCYQAWVATGDLMAQFAPDWQCFPGIVVTGFGPAVLMVLMLRRGAPISPRISIALGALAASAIADFGLRLFHPQDVSIMVLVWQVGTVFLLSAIAGMSGRTILRWKLRSPLEA